MFNNQILRILTQKCSPCQKIHGKSQQMLKFTASAKIHGFREFVIFI